MEQKVDDILDIVIFLKDSIGEQFGEVNNQFGQIDQRFGQIDQRFEQIDQRFDTIDVRFAYVNSELTDIKAHVMKNTKSIDALRIQSNEDLIAIATNVAEHDARIRTLEKNRY